MTLKQLQEEIIKRFDINDYISRDFDNNIDINNYEIDDFITDSIKQACEKMGDNILEEKDYNRFFKVNPSEELNNMIKNFLEN